MKISIDAIVVGDRLRPLRPEVVDGLVESIREVGLLQPIVVRANGDNKHDLVAGRHRLEAVKQLGHTTIEAKQVRSSLEDMDVQLAEIDENLKRGDLTPVEVAEHQRIRAEIFYRKNEERRRQVEEETARREAERLRRLEHERRKSRTKSHEVSGQPAPKPRGTPAAPQGRPKSYDSQAAAAQGKDKKTVQRERSRGDALQALKLTANELRGTSLDAATELDALTELNKQHPEAAQALARQALAGQKVKATTELKKHKRNVNEKSKAERITQARERLGQKQYGVILADPPWDFEVWSEGGKDRSAENHYPVASLDDLAALPVPKAAYEDSILFLWVTTPMLADGLWLMEEWGFEYVSALYWDKGHDGTGYWVRDRVEPLLIGRRGKPVAPAPGSQMSSLYSEAKTRHSAKPTTIRDWIAATWPNTPRLEMFARDSAAGWDTWGAEAPEA